jgi:hypothetical protein
MRASTRVLLGAALSGVLFLGGCEAVLGLGNETSASGDAGADATSAGKGDAASDTGRARDATADAWVPIAFNTAGTATCPSGFASTEVIEVTTSGSCTCGACNPAGPDCESSEISLTTLWPGGDGGTTCTAMGVVYVPNGGNCEPGVISPVSYMSITASAPPPGTCSATATAFEPKAKSEIVCTPAHCVGDCTSNLGSEFQACLYQMGGRACPEHTTRHLVGSQATTTCGACSCSVTATCTGTFAIYTSSTACMGAPDLTVPVDGTCHPMTNVSAQDSYIYTASPTNVICDAGTSAASDRIDESATVCCP